MNLYRCHLNSGDIELDTVTPLIVAETRNQAKCFLLDAVNDAGFIDDWTTPVSIRIEQKNVTDSPGILRYA